MVKAEGLVIFFLLFTMTSLADEGSFEMPLPEIETQTPSSENFVGSFEKELAEKELRKAPAKSQETSATAEDAKGLFESAFTSYNSKKNSENEEIPTDEWQKGLDKKDNFDLENLTYSEPSEASQVKKTHQKFAPKITPPSRSRAPASQESSPVAVSAKDRKAAVMNTVSEHYEELKTCYHEGLKSNADMKGKVVMGWSMDIQGRVSGVEVLTSQLHNKQVEKCMAERLANWRFPPQAKIRGSKDRMTYAFEFVSEKE